VVAASTEPDMAATRMKGTMVSAQPTGPRISQKAAKASWI
jgi:hypothetical protein